MDKEKLEFLNNKMFEATDEKDKEFYKSLISELMQKNIVSPPIEATKIIENVVQQAIDPVEKVKKDRQSEEEVISKARESLELEAFINGFDDSFKMLIPEVNKLNDINKADMELNHKTVRKIKLILENKDNYNLLPLSQRNVADKILNTNLTNESDIDLKEAKILVMDIQGIKQDLILRDARVNSMNSGVANQETLRQKDFMKRAILNVV